MPAAPESWRALLDRQEALSQRLRERPCRRFSENPFVRCFPDEAAGGVTHLWFDAHQRGASVWMHLIEGEAAALLIDTGYGIGDLKSVVSRLTAKPLIVVNTHWHGDHTGGNAQFGSVWCHLCDAGYLARQAAAETPRLLPPPSFYAPADLVPLAPGGIRTFTDGHCFDLGGRTVRAVHLPGHSAGNCAFLDSATGILFSGDAVLASPTLIIDAFPAKEYADLQTVRAFSASLCAAMPGLAGVSALCPGHAQQRLPPALLQAMCRCCREVLSAPAEQDERYGDVPGSTARMHCCGGAMLVYTPDRVG